MNVRLFWKALLVQALLAGALFGVLVALPLPDDFFRDYGVVTGPLAWILCSAATARILTLPLGFVAFGALAGGVAGGLVLLAAGHTPGMIAALLVFSASCASYEPDEPSAGEMPPSAGVPDRLPDAAEPDAEVAAASK